MNRQAYETDRILSEYLLFHFGEAEDILPYKFGPRDALHFPVRCVSECVDTFNIPHEARALDIGCSVGRSTFELARYCTEVIGIDFSKAFIDAANELKEHGSVDYYRPWEGHISLRSIAAVPEEIDRNRVSFETGDACALRDDLGSFDIVIACNLICRLPDPMAFISRLSQLVNPDGQLILTTPFSWLEDFTPVDNWLGGTEEKGDSFNALRAALEPAFAIRDSFDMPFLIREHARKYQWSVAQASCWRRNDDS